MIFDEPAVALNRTNFKDRGYHQQQRTQAQILYVFMSLEFQRKTHSNDIFGMSQRAHSFKLIQIIPIIVLVQNEHPQAIRPTSRTTVGHRIIAFLTPSKTGKIITYTMVMDRRFCPS